MQEVSKKSITDIDLFNMALDYLGFEPINEEDIGLEKVLYDDLFPIIKNRFSKYWDLNNSLFLKLLVLKTAMELCIPLGCGQLKFVSLKQLYENALKEYNAETLGDKIER